jgi:uncharacterized protein
MPQNELTQLHLPARHLQTLQTLLLQHVPQAEVWAYGSRVSGGAHEGSDLDLVLRQPAQLSADVDGWSELKDALQDSDLPILVEVHLWSRLPATFYPQIEAAYVVIQQGHGDRSDQSPESGVSNEQR